MDVGVNESSKKKLVRSTIHGWSCGKLGDENLAMRADAQNVDGKWRRERPKLRWGLH